MTGLARNYLNYAKFLLETEQNYGSAILYYQQFFQLQPYNDNKKQEQELIKIQQAFDKTDKGKANKLLFQAAKLLEKTSASKKATKQQGEKIHQLVTKGLKLSPDNAGLLGIMAVYYQRFAQDNQQAEQYYQKAIKVPNAPASDIARNLALYAEFLQNTKKQTEVALDYYQRAIKKGRILPYNYAHYARLLEEKKDLKATGVIHKKSIKAWPAMPSSYVNYSRFLQRKGDEKGMERNFHLALRHRLQDSNDIGNYAFWLWNKQRFNDAENYLRLAIKYEEKTVFWLHIYSVFLSHVRKNQDAVFEVYEQIKPFYHKLHQKTPNDVNNLMILSFIEIMLKNPSQAEQYLQQAFVLKSAKKPIFLSLFAYSHFADKFPDAKKNLEDAIRTNTFPNAHFFYLQALIDSARENKHPNIALLEKFAAQIKKQHKPMGLAEIDFNQPVRSSTSKKKEDDFWTSTQSGRIGKDGKEISEFQLSSVVLYATPEGNKRVHRRSPSLVFYCEDKKVAADLSFGKFWRGTDINLTLQFDSEKWNIIKRHLIKAMVV